LIMLFLIPAYLIVIAYLKDKIHPVTYPIALFMIGLGLILMYALTSAHIIGRDVHQEYYFFQIPLFIYKSCCYQVTNMNWIKGAAK